MNAPYPAEELLQHYRLMLVIRAFEETLSELFGEGLIPGTAHFCIGQEACAVGAIAALEPDDLVTSNHRGHGHLLAKGGQPDRLMAELFGKATGYCAGRSGSQHLCNLEAGFLGSNGITGGMVPVATGAALSQKLLDSRRIVLCFFGDGATGQGAFAEAINMAATWRLPIVYFCENNQYAMSLHVRQAFAEPSAARRFAGFGLPTVCVDGMDYFAVRQATEDAVARARRGDGPTLIEAETYRFCGHSKSDDCAYRSRSEEERWRAKDPIAVMRRRLMNDGVLDEGADRAIRQQAHATIEKALEFARNSPYPEPRRARSGAYAGQCG